MMFCDDERRCLVQLSLYQDEEMLLRRLAEAEGLAPATLAHEVLIEGLRCLLEEYGGLDALAALDDRSDGPWYAEGCFMHLDQAG
jgi:hypothetical protein